MKIWEILEGKEGFTFWGSFLENPEGKGGGRVMQQIPSVGVVWIFSGTLTIAGTSSQ